MSPLLWPDGLASKSEAAASIGSQVECSLPHVATLSSLILRSMRSLPTTFAACELMARRRNILILVRGTQPGLERFGMRRIPAASHSCVSWQTFTVLKHNLVRQVRSEAARAPLVPTQRGYGGPPPRRLRP